MIKFFILSFLLNTLLICNTLANISIFHKIVQEKPYYILEIDKNKCYLDPNYLVFEKGHIYLTDCNFNYIELPAISIDKKGYFIDKLNDVDDELLSFGWGIYSLCSRCVFLPMHKCLDTQNFFYLKQMYEEKSDSKPPIILCKALETNEKLV